MVDRALGREYLLPQLVLGVARQHQQPFDPGADEQWASRGDDGGVTEGQRRAGSDAVERG